MATLKAFIPTLPEISKEAITVIAGLLIASYLISRFPAVQKFVAGNSITVRDGLDNVLF